jgi:hypothetical protein
MERKGRQQIRLAGLLAGLITTAAACGSDQGGSPPGGAETTAPPAAASAPAGRVFFIEPQEGATVKSPVLLRFGIENFAIAPVPQGTVDVVRENTGHHHVGVDTECLPPGTVIPMAAPWVHFGSGANQIEMQLTPGPHRLALQVGDDKHTTIAGLCSTINVTVAE